MEQKQKNTLIAFGALSLLAFLTRKFCLPTKAELSIHKSRLGKQNSDLYHLYIK